MASVRVAVARPGVAVTSVVVVVVVDVSTVRIDS